MKQVQFVDQAAVKKALAAIEKEQAELKRRNGVLRVQKHRLRKLLAAAKSAQP